MKKIPKVKVAPCETPLQKSTLRMDRPDYEALALALRRRMVAIVDSCANIVAQMELYDEKSNEEKFREYRQTLECVRKLADVKFQTAPSGGAPEARKSRRQETGPSPAILEGTR